MNTSHYPYFSSQIKLREDTEPTAEELVKQAETSQREQFSEREVRSESSK